ncbi:MAG: N-formylglutamate amidohydrolase [bacterium]
MMDSGILVVVPHSGIVIPSEISIDTLSDDFAALAQNVDWYTNWLYDFRDILGNRHLVFPYCSIVLEGNRHPDILDDSVPLRDVNGRAVYRAGAEPNAMLRTALAEKYLRGFHQSIEDHITTGATFLFDGHSTVTARGVTDNQIDLMNFQHSHLDEVPLHYCPDIYVETYAAELRKRLPGVKVTVNESEYYTVYGHVCAAHSVNAMARVGSRVPAFIQETNERLYKNPDRTPNITAINRLRRAFAESLMHTLRLVAEIERRPHGD